jgi:2-hydroxy-6-oxonona-2,4-dienedioate hydrolase
MAFLHDRQEQDVPAPARVSGLAAHIIGAGPDLILFHGGFGSWTHWIRNVEALARRFRVTAFDLPGYGDSADVPSKTTPDGYIEWVADAVAAAAPGRIHLAGFSFGGALAARIAALLGDRVKRLSLLGPGGFGVPVGRVIPQKKLPARDAAADLRHQIVAWNLGQWMLSAPPPPDDPVVALQLANIERTRFDSRRISLEATLFGDLTRIMAPIQIVWGASDKLAFPSVQARAENCCEVRPDLHIAIVPEGAHWVQYEQPEAVNQLILDFHRE